MAAVPNGAHELLLLGPLGDHAQAVLNERAQQQQARDGPQPRTARPQEAVRHIICLPHDVMHGALLAQRMAPLLLN